MIRCGQIVGFRNPIAVNCSIIRCLLIPCNCITIRQFCANAIICQAIRCSYNKVRRNIGKCVNAILIGCCRSIRICLDILLRCRIVVILFQCYRNTTLTLFRSILYAVIIGIFPNNSLNGCSFPLLETCIQICIISCLDQIVVFLFCLIRCVNVRNVCFTDKCPIVVHIRFCWSILCTCRCFLCQNQHFMPILLHRNWQSARLLTILHSIRICYSQLAVYHIWICIIPILGCCIIGRKCLQNHLITSQIQLAIFLYESRQICKSIGAGFGGLMGSVGSIYQYPLILFITILLQGYSSWVFAAAVKRFLFILDTIVIGICPNNALNGCCFELLQSTVISRIVCCLDEVISISMIARMQLCIIVKNVRFKIGISIDAGFCFRLGFLCCDEIITVCRRSQIRCDIIIGISCTILIISCNQMTIQFLRFHAVILAITSYCIMRCIAWQRQ